MFPLLDPSLLDTALYMHVMKSGCGIIVCMYGRSLGMQPLVSLHSVFHP